jgi:hypothetical protein
MATAGFVLSMVSVVTFYLLIPPILGIIFSSIGLTRASVIAEKTGVAKGKALAIVGLFVSILLIIGGLGWVSVL